MLVVDEEVDRSAAPAAVRAALATLEERFPEQARLLIDDAGLRAAVVAVVAASRSLTRALLADDAAVGVLADLGTRPALAACGADADGLARWKRLELLRLAARDLTLLDDLPATGRGLSLLADDVLRTALELGGQPGLGVIAMGKAGAVELNYASDVDVLFVGEGDARPVLEVAGRCFRVDADLRPEGRDGPLVRSLAAYEAYWDRWAQTWEFQALLKARPVAGPAELLERFAEAAANRVWGRPFDADDLRSVRSMKARAEQEVAKKGLTTRELKRGRGGIRDVEFSVQLLQLVHGRSDPALRTPATLDALRELCAAGLVAEADADALAEAYTFLRVVEHRLQLVDEQQVHAVPSSSAAREHLARVLGYRDDERSTAVALFEADLVRHQAVARSIHERLFFRPLLEAFTRAAGPLAPEQAEERLSALGFTDAERTRQALVELTRGFGRANRLLASMLPLLLEWLSEAPDPDLGLLGLRTLASGAHRSARLGEAFRESAEAARRLCTIVGTSRFLTTTLERQPELLGRLADDEDLRPRSREDLEAAARAAMAVRDPEDRASALQRLRVADGFRLAAADLLGVLPEGASVSGAMTALGEALLTAALEAVEPPGAMAVVAMGRFGGAELAYASDLDLVVVYDDVEVYAAEADAAVGRLVQLLRGATPAQRVWDVDLDLRPGGRSGKAATPVTGLGEYFDRWAQTWERQAWVRARVVAGDAALGAKVADAVDRFVWARPFTDAEAREVRRMKARVERERIPPGEDPDFHLKLGRGSLGDVEWTVQLLQLQHGVRGTTTLPALDALVAAGALPADDAAVLAEAWRYCQATRDRWFLVKGSPGDSLPRDPHALAVLARSLGTNAAGLRNEHRRVTRRARSVVEARFYGGDLPAEHRRWRP